MKKRVIALIIAIPLILIFSIFSVTNVASLAIEIPVNSVVIMVEGRDISGEIYYLDIASSPSLQVGAYVIPRKATGQGVTFYKKAIEGKEHENILLDTVTGKVTAQGLGSVQIIARSTDGGREDSFILVAWSSKATSLEIEGAYIEGVLQDVLKQNDRFVMSAAFAPLSDIEDTTIRWSSSDTSIVEIGEYSGVARAHSSGEVLITATMQGLNGMIVANHLLNVEGVSSPSGIITSGGQNALEYSLSTYADFDIWISYEEIKESLTDFDRDNPFVVDYAYGYEIISSSSSDNPYKYRVRAEIGAGDAVMKIRINDSYYDFEEQTKYSSITLAKLTAFDLDYDFLISETLIHKSTKIVPIEILPNLAGVRDILGLSFEISTNNSCITINGTDRVAGSGTSFSIKAEQLGTTEIEVRIFSHGEHAKTFVKTVEVIAPYASLEFAENSKSWGLADIFTFGKESIVDNAYAVKGYQFDLRGRLSGSTSGKRVEDIENITFVVSDESVATVVNGKLMVTGNGIVTVTARSGSASAMLRIKCVLGVNIHSYDELVFATDKTPAGEKRALVIQEDIYLGRELYKYTRDESGKIINIESQLPASQSARDILMSEVKEMDTTADATYYNNKGMIPPKIKYCIELAKDVHGNGYMLNGQNITYMLDSTDALRDSAIFRGPLDMVAMEGAAVKAQDNIVFLVRDNVHIDNIELKGADDVDDLTKLNYVGTVVEVMGDNVTISNSRINNGRTALRIFGKEDADALINVKIVSSIISHAREFLLKMGTNKYLLGKQISATVPEFENCAPKLGNYNHLAKDANLNNPDFVDNYVKTKVTIQDCVIYNSGLYAIGIESKFAGPCLDGFAYGNHNFADLGWKNIAGTSYAAVLKLVGDVRIYDWKNIDYVDSSTLIEGETINFDVKSMIKKLEQNHPSIFIKEGLDYFAHGGIALFGGGKNYSIVDTTQFEGVTFNEYTVGFDELGEGWESKILPYAAGREPFQFLMYDNNTESLTYAKQKEDMHSGAWLSWLPVYEGEQ